MTVDNWVLVVVLVVWVALGILLLTELVLLAWSAVGRWRRYRRHLHDRPASNRRATWKHVR